MEKTSSQKSLKNNHIIVFSTDDFLYPAGGAEASMGEIFKRLPHITFDLICARLRPGVSAYEQVNNVRIHRIGFGIPKLDGLLLALLGYHKARQIHQRHPADLVWSLMASYGAFAAVKTKKQLHIPFVLTLQEGKPVDRIEHSQRFIQKRFKEIFTQADRIQTISTYLAKWAKHMGATAPIDVVPNGVALEDFKPQPKIEHEDTILLTTSRLEKKNGVGDIIEALVQLPSSVRLVICGTGSLEKELKAHVQRVDLTSRVVFKGFVDRDQLPHELQAADIFVRPSLSEGLGISFLEAMAMRVPVVATRVGGLQDFLFDNKTGFVCKPSDPDDIARTIKRVMALDAQTKESIVTNAENMMHEKYNWDTITQQIENIFIHA